MLPSISFTLTEKSSTIIVRMVSLNLLSLRHLGFTDEADTEVGWWTLTASAASWNMFEHETDEKDAVTQVVSDGERSVGIYSDTEEIQIVSHRTVTVCCCHCCHHCCSSGEGWSRSHSASFVSSSYAPDSCCCNTIITVSVGSVWLSGIAPLTSDDIVQTFLGLHCCCWSVFPPVASIHHTPGTLQYYTCYNNIKYNHTCTCGKLNNSEGFRPINIFTTHYLTVHCGGIMGKNNSFCNI